MRHDNLLRHTVGDLLTLLSSQLALGVGKHGLGDDAGVAKVGLEEGTEQQRAAARDEDGIQISNVRTHSSPSAYIVL